MTMDRRELTAPCGLDCFNCNLYEENLTEEYRAKVAAYRNIAPENVACRGCRAEQGKCRYAQFGCATWDCAQKKQVSYCYECNEFPCGLLAPTAKGANFPHNMKVYNLCRMKLLGLDAWAAEAAHIRKRYYEGEFVVGQGPILKEGLTLLLIGSGGREHAICAALKKNSEVTKVYAIPGNGGMAEIAECVPEIKATEIEKICEWAEGHRIDFAVPAADDPLCLGAVDALEAMGIPCFGPDKAAAQIEGSKVFSKDLMKKYGIPTASYEVFGDAGAALAYLDTYEAYPVVIKADGLALGKGVIIAQSRDEARAAVREIMEDKKFGASGSRIVVEEFLTGPEVSVLSFADGKTVVPMVSSMDHKRARDNDEGLNTGGMGVIAPNPFYTPEIAVRCMEEIFKPTIAAMAQEGRPFKGCLYFGLMLTPQGPKVIEYNCRFGDPECQAILPLLETDLLEIFRACREGQLHELDIHWREGHACCVVLASGGYPEKYTTGFPIAFGDTGDAAIYHAGTKRLPDGTAVTAGGRVLNVVALGDTLPEAVARAYEAAGKITFEGAFCRGDIGRRAMEAETDG